MERAITLVVPCYNEANRFSADAFRTFAETDPRVRFVFVNDGSTDDTALVLDDLVASAPDRFECVNQARNRGKAEAVRVGMLRAIAHGAHYAGYWDADLATPLHEVTRFIQILETNAGREICFGARVQLLGRRINRRPHRHYAGRVFAAIASVVLGMPVYDTQCGAKLFRVSPDMHALFAERFLGRWTFDIEIVARLARQRAHSRRPGPSELIYELPLDEWQDVEDSKVGATDFVTALIEIARIRRKYFRRMDPTTGSGGLDTVRRPADIAPLSRPSAAPLLARSRPAAKAPHAGRGLPWVS